MPKRYEKTNSRPLSITTQDRLPGLYLITTSHREVIHASSILAKRFIKVSSVVLLCIASTGCSAMPPTMHIVNHLPDGRSKHYQEKFEEAYFTVDGSSQIDLVLRRSDREGVSGRDDLVQVVHIRTFWRSIPGITVAESTQINATITYSITRGTQTTVLRGAGSVLIKLSKNGNSLTGTIERAVVKPIEQVNNQALFEKAELSGRFTAIKDRRRTIRISNELEAISSSVASTH